MNGKVVIVFVVICFSGYAIFTWLAQSKPKYIPKNKSTNKEQNKLHIAGKKIFQKNCAFCHGDQGQGGVGPDLTDDHWVYGKGNIKDIAKIISKGVAGTSMGAWDFLGEQKIIETATYVKSLPRKTSSSKTKGAFVFEKVQKK